VEVSGLGNNWCRCRTLPSDKLIETSEERERGGMAYLSYLDSGNSDAEVRMSQSAAVACSSLVTCVLLSGVERVRMVEQLDIKTEHSRDLAGSSSAIENVIPRSRLITQVLATCTRYLNTHTTGSHTRCPLITYSTQHKQGRLLYMRAQT